MNDFSSLQSRRIAEKSTDILRRRQVVQRIEGELVITKENLKIARQELQFAYNDLDNITADALSGKEPLPNLIDHLSAKR